MRRWACWGSDDGAPPFQSKGPVVMRDDCILGNGVAPVIFRFDSLIYGFDLFSICLHSRRGTSKQLRSLVSPWNNCSPVCWVCCPTVCKYDPWLMWISRTPCVVRMAVRQPQPDFTVLLVNILSSPAFVLVSAALVWFHAKCFLLQLLVRLSSAYTKTITVLFPPPRR